MSEMTATDDDIMKAEGKDSSISSGVKRAEDLVDILYSDMVQSLVKNWRVGESEDIDSRLSLHDGFVKVEFENGNSYEGNLSRGQMNGEGAYRWGSGESYKGKFLDNSIHGEGKFEWNDQSWYEGEFFNGFRHGIGNLVSHQHARFYIGQWHTGRKHGNGYCRYNRDDDYYDGDWKMGLRHGSGNRVYANGARYSGNWENDRKNGLGTMIWPSGDVYRGNWKDGLMNGYGEYVWNGFFNKSLSWPRENCYMGEWIDGMRHGRGILKLNSVGGAKYVGDWRMNEKHGYGMIIGNSGAVTEADPLFLNDVLTPLDVEATHLEKPESEESDSSNEEFTNSSSRIRKTVHRKPRMTTVMEPLQLPALRFHVQRLFQTRYQRLECSVAPVTASSRKCRLCRDDSACSCLRNSSTGDDVSGENESVKDSRSFSEMTETSSTSSKFLAHPVEETECGTERTKEQYEEHWVHNCLTTNMVELRKIYKQYGELYLGCEEENQDRLQSLSMSKISLWQLLRDCEIHTKGIGLAELERRLVTNGSAFIETAFYPFERIEFFQFIHALLEISWHIYARINDVETEAVRGILAGGLHRLLVNDIFPKAGKCVGKVKRYLDILPIYSVYQLYRYVGEPHSVRQLLRATCLPEGSDDPEPLPLPEGYSTPIPKGMNAIICGEKLSYIPSKESPTEDPGPEPKDKFAYELFALRHIGTPGMVSVVAKICPAVKDQETGMIIDMDYELTFLEFYEILLEATIHLISTKKASELESETRRIETEAVAASRSESLKSEARSKERSSRNLRKNSKRSNRGG